MKKTLSIFLAVIFSLLSLYAIVDIIESIYLISRYENFTLSSLGFIAGKTLFYHSLLSCDFYSCEKNMQTHSV